MSDDGYDDLVEGVRDALREAGVEWDSPELWAGLRRALDEALVQEPAPPGGPRLRVVDPEETPEERPPVPASSGVRVVRVAAPATVRARTTTTATLDSGVIAVAGERWQTLFRGRSPRTYRVHATSGQLDLAVDGELVERLAPGQSIDIEGELVRACGVEGASATGLYRRLD